MTYFLTFWPIIWRYDVVTICRGILFWYHDVLPYFLSAWRICLRYDVHFDGMTYFLTLQTYFLMPLCIFGRHAKLFEIMTYVLTCGVPMYGCERGGIFLWRGEGGWYGITTGLFDQNNMWPRLSNNLTYLRTKHTVMITNNIMTTTAKTAMPILKPRLAESEYKKHDTNTNTIRYTILYLPYPS